MTVEQILASIDVEGGMGFLMQGTDPDELGARPGAVPGPVVPLQEIQQRNALFEPFQILAHGAHRSPRLKLRTLSPSSQARMVGKQENLVPLRGAAARRLAKTETGSARTSARNRTRVARRGSAIAPRLPGQIAERKMRVAKNPGCGTSGAEWKG